MFQYSEQFLPQVPCQYHVFSQKFSLYSAWRRLSCCRMFFVSSKLIEIQMIKYVHVRLRTSVSPDFSSHRTLTTIQLNQCKTNKMAWTAFILLFALTANVFITAADPCDDVPSDGRVDCGYYGINQPQCEEDRGCCWDESVENVPWCFTQGLEAPPAEQCKTAPESRVDCGWYGIDQKVCESKGCCWGETDVPNAPWCFNAATADPCGDVPSDDRVDCGYYGIDQPECVKDRGCCWDNSVKDVPYCFTQGLEAPPAEQCKTAPESRVDCGWYGIDQTVCESKGCCWGETDVPGAPWCFNAVV